MGKTKWFSEAETSNQQEHRSNAAGNRQRQTSFMPGRVTDTPVNSYSAGELFRMLLFRLQRSWLALGFRLHALSGGFFRKQTLMKVGVLALVAFIAFHKDDSDPTVDEGRSIFTRFTDDADEDVSDGKTDHSSWSLSGTDKKEKKTKKVEKREKSDVSPVKPSEIKDGKTRTYIERYQEIARKEMYQYGVPASISLAQGLIESRGGTSTLAKQNNNHFGIKCFMRNCPKGHCTNHTDDTHKDFFRNYKSSWECWRDHSKMISTGRYAKLKKYGRDYRKWAYGLKSVGYATDRTYAEKLIEMIERYDLNRYDN